MNKLYRAYVGKRPVTTVWRRTKKEAIEDFDVYGRPSDSNKTVVERDINDLLKNRKKTGFRGLL